MKGETSYTFSSSYHTLLKLKLSSAEMVEVLFARGLVKVLFATETFAMVSTVFFSDLLETMA